MTRGTVKRSLFPVSPCLPVSLSFFFGEGIEEGTRCHPQDANEEGEVISFCRIRMTHTREGFDDLSQGGHEDRCSRHREEIDPCHHRARDGNRKEAFGMGVDHHSKGIEETHEKENEAIPYRTLNFENTS